MRSKVRQTEKYFSATSIDRENFARFPNQNFDFQRFQGAAGVGPYMSLLTDEQGQFFQARSETKIKFKVYFPQPEPTSSIADASAAAAQKKPYAETLKRANNSIDVLGIKDKIVTPGPTAFNKKFGTKIC